VCILLCTGVVRVCACLCVSLRALDCVYILRLVAFVCLCMSMCVHVCACTCAVMCDILYFAAGQQPLEIGGDAMHTASCCPAKDAEG